MEPRGDQTGHDGVGRHQEECDPPHLGGEIEYDAE